VREQFDDKELSTLTFRVAGINAWNRADVAFRNTHATDADVYSVSVSLRL
jgi:hypothetical protein